MKRILLSSITVLALLVTLSACDSNGSSNDGDDNGNNDPLGTYSATVTGAASQEMSGTAVAAGTSAETGWGLALGGTTGDFITIASPASNRPSKGVYPVIPFGDAGGTLEPDKFVASLTLQSGSAVYTSTGGSIEVTSSTSSRVKGTFSFTAVGFQDEIVTVNGIFDAINTGG